MKFQLTHKSDIILHKNDEEILNQICQINKETIFVYIIHDFGVQKDAVATKCLIQTANFLPFLELTETTNVSFADGWFSHAN